MARISISGLDKARPVEAPSGFSGSAKWQALFDRPQDPIHLHLHRLMPGTTLHVAPATADCALYVWKGAVDGGGHRLPAGSSMIVEQGATLDLEGAEEETVLVSFGGSHPAAKAGGAVHLLPDGQVPRAESLAGVAGVGGGIHADASCPGCSVWLHENHFAPPQADAPPADPKSGIHSHSEDEVIFVTAGSMRLGGRLYGPGTALAIAADTLYSFGNGPEGLSIINFRPGLPGLVRFPNGNVADEVGYWRNLGTPRYLEPVA